MACSVPTDITSFYDNALNKRIVVQKFLHQLYLEDKLKRKASKKQVNASDTNTTSIPVVRFGVLTMFPLIEALNLC